MSEPNNLASFDPDAFFTPAGLLDDADVVVTGAKFGLFTYPNSTTTTTALIVNYDDADGKAHEQPYSVGDPEKFSPSEDGKSVLLNNVRGINASSNFAQYISSLINSGVEKAFFQTADISRIVGMKLHVNAVAQRDREGKEVKNAKGYNRTVLLATKLIAMPGAKAAAPAVGAPKTAGKKAAGAPATAAAPAASAPASEELVARVIGYIGAAAVSKGGSIKRQAITPAVFQLATAAKDADKLQIPKLAFDPAFLEANSGTPTVVGDGMFTVTYDKATETITAEAA